MRATTRSFAALAALLAPLAGCMSVRGDGLADVSASVDAATAYWFRGAPFNTRGVVQSELATSVPLRAGGAVDVSVWTNLDVQNDTGGGLLADGNAMHFSEVDVSASYGWTYDGVELDAGLVSYNLPNQAMDSTTEVFGSAEVSGFGLNHLFTLYYDFDVLDGFYLSWEALYGRPLDERTQLDATFRVGAMGGDQARAYFGVDQNGIADLSLTGTWSRRFDEATTLRASATILTVVDRSYADALDAQGRDDAAIVLNAGVRWTF